MEPIKKMEDMYKTIEPIVLDHVKKLDVRISESGETLEGNCFYINNTFRSSWFFVYKRINYVSMMKNYNIKKMIEIGLNGGHSAAVFLSVMPADGSMLFFDLTEHKYTRPCYDYLKQTFPQVRDLVAGDSVQMIPKWMWEHKEEVGTFDCVHVDGGHSPDVSFADMTHADRLLRPGGIMILDDTQINYITEYIPYLLQRGYNFIYQIPTYIYSHVMLQKPM